MLPQLVSPVIVTLVLVLYFLSYVCILLLQVSFVVTEGVVCICIFVNAIQTLKNQLRRHHVISPSEWAWLKLALATMKASFVPSVLGNIPWWPNEVDSSHFCPPLKFWEVLLEWRGGEATSITEDSGYGSQVSIFWGYPKLFCIYTNS